MKFSFMCFVLFFTTEFVSTAKQCRMPSGDTGECKLLKNCKPLSELNKKKSKIEDELLYLKQSSCGDPKSFQFLICCPSESQWSILNSVKPVKFDQIMKYGTDLKEKTNVNINNHINHEGDNRVLMKNGGGPTTIDLYPWLVLFEYAVQARCGGSLITKRYVLTAAHCIRFLKPKFALLGEYNTSSYPTDYVKADDGSIEEITVDKVPIEINIAHPNYKYLQNHNDIGLSRLKRDADIGEFINIICLPTRDFIKDFKRGLNFTVAGWGSDGAKYSEVKKHVDVPYVPAKECQQSIRYSSGRIIDSQICAGGRENEDSCRGDSGGPLMYKQNGTYIAIGIVSFGSITCGTANFPSVYTYVYSYLDWLEAYIV